MSTHRIRGHTPNLRPAARADHERRADDGDRYGRAEFYAKAGFDGRAGSGERVVLVTAEVLPGLPGTGCVRGQLVDAITEELLRARGAGGRAEVVSEIVEEMVATVRWLHESGTVEEPLTDELASIARVARAAEEHQTRMGGSGALLRATTAKDA